MNRLELRFSTAADMSRAAYQLIKRIVGPVLKEQARQDRFMLAVGEAVDNAVIHGNKFAVEKLVRIEYVCDETKITFMVEDQGCGFGYRAHLDTPLSEYEAVGLIAKTVKYGTPGGLGLALIRKCVDEVNFTPPGNKLTFVKYL
jgi:serine/threonine-protein kinase RsbW